MAGQRHRFCLRYERDRFFALPPLCGKSQPVIVFHRRGESRVAFEEISNGTEIIIPRTADLRSPAADLVMLIKQTALRKKSERDVKLQNNQLTAILSATPLGIFQMRNATIEWINHPLAALLETSESAIVGKPVSSLFVTEEEFGQASGTSKSTGMPSATVVRSARAGADRRGDHCLSPQARLLDPLDAKKGGTVVVTDISDKKKMRDALKESEAKYREMMQNAQSIIIRMDMQGVITYVNTYAAAFFDYPDSGLVGKNVVGTIVPEKNRGGHDLSMMANDLGFNAEGYAINVSENIRRNGDIVWIAWINKAIRDPQGHIVEVLCIGHDITDRKRTGEVRISTDTWKDQVVADTDVREEVFDSVFHICTEISIRAGKEKRSARLFSSATRRTCSPSPVRSCSMPSKAMYPRCAW